MKKLLIIGDPKGTHSITALNTYSPENIWVWENDSRHIYTINQIHDRINVITDFDEVNDMRFNVVIGNPPYQRPREVRNIGAPIWPDFIESSLEHVLDDGIIKLIIPSTWMNRRNGKAWNLIKSNNLVFCDPDVKWAFPNVGGHGGTFSLIHLKKGDYCGKTSIRGEFDIDIINDIIPSNNKMMSKDNIEFLHSMTPKLLAVDVKSGPINPSINSNNYSKHQTDRHKFNIYYSGASDRKSIWCCEPIGDYGELKLVVPNSGNNYNNMEITTKGAGRQTNYVLGTQKELETLRDMMLSEDSRRMNKIMSEGNYNSPLKWIVNNSQ